MKKKKRILMVCLGNICRSPVAEGIMLKLVEERGLDIEVDSAGTAGYHVNEPPDPRTIENALKNGLDLRALRARKFCRDDFDKFDHIFVMDANNYKDVIAISKDPSHHEKVEYLLNVLHPGKNLAVPDPWFGGEDGFEEVFHLVREACEKLADKLCERDEEQGTEDKRTDGFIGR